MVVRRGERLGPARKRSVIAFRLTRAGQGACDPASPEAAPIPETEDQLLPIPAHSTDVPPLNNRPPGGLLTSDEVAALLGVTTAWVYDRARKRRIPHLRLGRYIRFRREALDAWIEEVEASSCESHRTLRA